MRNLILRKLIADRFTDYHLIVLSVLSPKSQENLYAMKHFVVAAFVLLYTWQLASADYYTCPAGYDYDCGDGYCVKSEKVCDGTDNCYNGADEEDCVYSVNVPLAIGLAVAGFVVFIVLPLVIIPIICCCCIGACASAASTPRRTRVVTTHAVPSGPSVTVVNSNQSSNTMQTYPPPYRVDPNTYQPAPPSYKM